MKNERLNETFNAWEEISQTPDTMLAYHSRLKAIIDEQAKLDYAKHKGIKKIVKIMIEKGDSNERKSNIEAIRNENNSITESLSF